MKGKGKDKKLLTGVEQRDTEASADEEIPRKKQDIELVETSNQSFYIYIHQFGCTT